MGVFETTGVIWDFLVKFADNVFKLVKIVIALIIVIIVFIAIMFLVFK